MSKFFGVVPWFNSDEWQKVYLCLSNESSSKEEALNLLLLWKARCPSLPSGIESTLNLLQVHVEDTRNTLDVENDQFLRLAYSSAVMRFVNHMLDSHTAKGSSLYQAAKNLGVPEWIIDLRHDTAHSHNLPPLTLLREACGISLRWLQNNYWEKHRPYIKDYVSGQTTVNSADDSKISALINFCFSLSICAHSNCNITNLSDIPDASLRESIVNDAKELLSDQIDFSNLKKWSVKSIINMMNEQASKILDVKDVDTLVNTALLGPDSLFLSKELLNFFSANEFRFKNRLDKNYVLCFEVLLTFLHTNDLLLSFIIELVKITQSDQPFVSQLASLWIAEILLALKKTKLFIEKVNRSPAKKEKPKKKKELVQLYKHWFPGDTNRHLFLDLQKPVPSELMDIKFIQPLIATYNCNLANFIKNLLDLIEPPLPTAVAKRVCTLAKLIQSPEQFPMVFTSTIYTAEDIKMSAKDDDVQIIETDSSRIREDIIDMQVDCQVIENSVWRLTSNEYDWSMCPIGQVPWQCMPIVTENDNK